MLNKQAGQAVTGTMVVVAVGIGLAWLAVDGVRKAVRQTGCIVRTGHKCKPKPAAVDVVKP